MLKDIAKSVWANAYAPYSKFKVGVAIKTIDGSMFSGVNVENAAYPEGTCAEAAAIAAMCAAGQREIVEVYVIADCKEPVPPCGLPPKIGRIFQTRCSSNDGYNCWKRKNYSCKRSLARFIQQKFFH